MQCRSGCIGVTAGETVPMARNKALLAYKTIMQHGAGLLAISHCSGLLATMEASFGAALHG